MISKMLLSGVAANSDYSVSITPSEYVIGQANNGSFTTSRFTANVLSGSGNYEYNWTLTSQAGVISIVTDTDQDYCILNAQGVNDVVTATLNCEVTDTNNSTIVSAESSIFINFGKDLEPF